jgi:hemolysin III
MPTVLFDASRDAYYAKPLLRGWMHLLWFEISLVVGTLLIVAAHGRAEVAAVAVFAVAISALFGVSALYHRGTWGARASRLLQRMDHTMIVVSIAATATPPFVLAAPGRIGRIGLIALWALAAAVVALRLIRMNAPERIVGAMFVGLGWIAGLSLPEVWVHGGSLPALLLISGGLLYTIGAVSYFRRWPDPYPAVFGYHEVFHTCVCVAAACHYAAVAVLVLH